MVGIKIMLKILQNHPIVILHAPLSNGRLKLECIRNTVDDYEPIIQ